MPQEMTSWRLCLHKTSQDSMLSCAFSWNEKCGRSGGRWRAQGVDRRRWLVNDFVQMREYVTRAFIVRMFCSSLRVSGRAYFVSYFHLRGIVCVVYIYENASEPVNSVVQIPCRGFAPDPPQNHVLCCSICKSWRRRWGFACWRIGRKLKLINENWRHFRQKLRRLFSCMFSFGLMPKNAFRTRLQNVGIGYYAFIMPLFGDIKINCTFRLRMNYKTYIPQALLSHKTRHAIAKPN